MHRGIACAVAEFVDLGGVDAVLDIATGTALVLRALASRDAQLRCFGIDISPGMLAVARSELPYGIFVDGAAEELPFEDSQFQLVTCVTALHLVSDPRAVFPEVARVLAPGGRLVLATFQIPPGHPVVDRPYRTNHTAYETPALIEAIAGPFGFNVTRSKVDHYGDDACLITELSL